MEHAPKFSPITVIEGSRKSIWEPKHVKERLERTRLRKGDRDKIMDAEYRRVALRREMVDRVAAHHSRVKTVAAGKHALPVSPSKARHEKAHARREQKLQQKKQRVIDHHRKIEVAVHNTKTRRTDTKTATRHRQAEARRCNSLLERSRQWQEKHQKIRTAQQTRQTRLEASKQSTRKVISGYKLDSAAIEEATFEQVQRVLTNRTTVTRAKELLQLLSHNFEKMLAEEKQVTTDDTPVGTSPQKLSGKLPVNPRQFLSAYICMGGLTQGTGQEPGPLDKAVQEHAAQVIDSLGAVLSHMEEETSDEDIERERELRAAMKKFANEWADYETSFAAWKKKDHKELLNHYITTYSEVERGRVDIIAQTAQKGSRRPEEHRELMTAIDASLEKIKIQIARLGGNDGIDDLTARLQEMYDQHQLTPTTAPAATPDVLSTASTPRSTATPRQASVSPSPKTPVMSEEERQKREKLQMLLTKAKMAHEAVFMTPDQKKELEKQEEQVEGLTVKKIKKAAEKAYWDILAEELGSDPPNVDRISTVLEGIKEQLLDITPRKMKANLETEMSDKVDWELLKQSLNYSTLGDLIKFFIGKILELEAPADNEATKAAAEAQLEYISSGVEMPKIVVSSFRFLSDKLSSLSKAIHDARKSLFGPLLAKDVESHVQALFTEELNQNAHQLQNTRQYLTDTLKAAFPLTPDSKPEDLGYKTGLTVEDIMNKSNKLYTIVPKMAILRCVTQPKTVDNNFPELLKLDRDLLRITADKIQLVTLSAAISGLSAQLTGSQKVMKPVADAACEMLSTPGIRLPHVIEEVIHIIDRELGKPTPEETVKLLTGMLQKVASPDDKVYQTYQKRLSGLISQLIISGPEGVPPVSSTPFAHLATQVQSLVLPLSKVATLNVKWCRMYYDSLLSSIVSDIQQANADALESGEL
eukprot:TRINITY_DN2726_c0_g1_i1.p1 TRINITY_DN2726_c0_g1~~TRINITY_DN2726_c0_g1_i1.p1  ORF type:complete len:948 (+),score=231.51 TRINITY_DN2726_c0_g1_i1:63-2846(+)